jgi:hypothetical protein
MFYNLWLVLQNYHVMSHPKRQQNLLNPTLACFNYLVFSLGWLTHMATCLSGGNVFCSYKRLLFWACMLHVNVFGFHLKAPLERPCGHRKCHHDEGTMCRAPSCHSLGIGHSRMMPSCLTLGKLQLTCD